MKQDKNMRIKWKTWRREDAPPAQVHRTDTRESLFLLNVLLRQMMIQELKGRRVVYVCLVKQIWVTSWNTKQDLWGMSLQLQLQLLAGPSVVGSVVLVSVWISSISAKEEVFVPRLVSANLLLCHLSSATILHLQWQCEKSSGDVELHADTGWGTVMHLNYSDW